MPTIETYQRPMRAASTFCTAVVARLARARQARGVLSIGYLICVSAGVIAGYAVSLAQRPREVLPARIRYLALVGAVGGAYLLQLPADAFGWSYQIAHEPPRWGHTVLGGLIGGWLAVELAKKLFKHQQPTGAHFALPLAIALCIGRLGCVFAGCCQGVALSSGSIFFEIARVLSPAALFPAALCESYFHAAAAAWLFLRLHRGRQRPTDFALYMVAYAILRFFLEFARPNPPIAIGLNYYQMLCVVLTAIALWRLTMMRGQIARSGVETSATNA